MGGHRGADSPTSAPIPVFADIDPDSWCISRELDRARVTPRTKAILTVDLYGGGARHGRDRARVAEASRLPIIEDAAQAIGVVVAGRARRGRSATSATFSFHGTKTLTTGEGGMLVTDRTDLFERVVDAARPRSHRERLQVLRHRRSSATSTG